jgi:hypothetical protein
MTKSVVSLKVFEKDISHKICLSYQSINFK